MKHMLIQDAAIPELILKIADHYNTNISTRFLRPFLAGILSDNEISRRISDMTEHSEAYTAQGIHLDELYLQIHAISRFVYLVRTDILPNLRSLAGSTGSSDANKVFRDMAMSNFKSNVQVLSDYINELYQRVIVYDKTQNGKTHTVAKGIPGLAEIGRYLVDK
jgi:hypothetical protein